MVLEPLGEDITNYGASSLGGDMVTKLGATLANPDASTVALLHLLLPQVCCQLQL